MRTLTACFAFLPLLVAPVVQEDTFARHKSYLKNSIERMNRLTDVTFYKDAKFKNEKGDVKTIDEIPELHRNVFYMVMAEDLAKNLQDAHAAWVEESGKLTSDDDKKILNGLAEQLFNTWKGSVARWDAHAKATFKKYEKSFTKEETEHYLTKISDYKKEHFEKK